MILLYVPAANHETIMPPKPLKLFWISLWGAGSCNNFLLFRETASLRHVLLSSDGELTENPCTEINNHIMLFNQE